MKQNLLKRTKNFVLWLATFSITIYLYDSVIARQGHTLGEYGLAVGVAFILTFTNLANPPSKKNKKKL